MQTFENLSYSPKLFNRYNIAHTHGPWVCVIKVCSNGGATQIWVLCD